MRYDRRKMNKTTKRDAPKLILKLGSDFGKIREDISLNSESASLEAVCGAFGNKLHKIGTDIHYDPNKGTIVRDKVQMTASEKKAYFQRKRADYTHSKKN